MRRLPVFFVVDCSESMVGDNLKKMEDGLQAIVRAAGEHRVEWDGRDSDGHAMRAGIYFLRLHAEDRSLNRKVVVMR